MQSVGAIRSDADSSASGGWRRPSRTIRVSRQAVLSAWFSLAADFHRGCGAAADLWLVCTATSGISRRIVRTGAAGHKVRAEDDRHAIHGQFRQSGRSLPAPLFRSAKPPKLLHANRVIPLPMFILQLHSQWPSSDSNSRAMRGLPSLAIHRLARQATQGIRTLARKAGHQARLPPLKECPFFFPQTPQPRIVRPLTDGDAVNQSRETRRRRAMALWLSSPSANNRSISVMIAGSFMQTSSTRGSTPRLARLSTDLFPGKSADCKEGRKDFQRLGQIPRKQWFWEGRMWPCQATSYKMEFQPWKNGRLLRCALDPGDVGTSTEPLSKLP